MFWTTRWSYRKISDWELILLQMLRSERHAYVLIRYRTLLRDAIIKLVLEKRLTREEGESLNDMLTSTDHESIKLGFMIMYQKKRKIFLKG
jgi:hypothetical protein